MTRVKTLSLKYRWRKTNLPDYPTTTQKEMGRPFAGELSHMLDAIAQTLAEQAAKPAVPATVHPSNAPLVAAQETVVPIPKPTISAPESLSPAFLPQPKRNEPTPPSAAATPVPAATNAANTENAPLGTKQSEQSAQSVDAVRQTAKKPTSQSQEQATAAQRLVLKQRLAELVAKDKSRKEAKLRGNLEAMAIASAQAGQLLQARQLAQDQMLSSEDRAALLAQINAISGEQVPTKTVQPPPRSLAAPLPTVMKPWKAPAPGRSRPSVLPDLPSQKSITASEVPQAAPEYVGYSLNGFGRTIGGFGVVIDSNTADLSGQNWIAYAPDNRFNAELWNGLSLIFPLAVPAPITSPFGWRVHPIKGNRRFHKGTDLGAPMGTPVLAAASGKVALSDWLGGYGLAIILSHQDNTQETLYAHLSKVFVKPGQWVEKGTIIGRVGSTGLSTGPHLHFELRQKTPSGWQAIDPGVQLKYALARLKALQSG